MSVLKSETAAILEIQARSRGSDDPTGGNINVVIRFFQDGHADNGYYWTGSAWQSSAAIVVSAQRDFHAHQYVLPNTALVSDMENGSLTARPADAGAVGSTVMWDIVGRTYEERFDSFGAAMVVVLAALETSIISEIDANETKIDALNDPTVAAIADAVWDEVKSGHVTAGSFGAEVQSHAVSSEIPAVVWGATMTDYDTTRTMGWLLNMMNDPRILPGD